MTPTAGAAAEGKEEKEEGDDTVKQRKEKNAIRQKKKEATKKISFSFKIFPVSSLRRLHRLFGDVHVPQQAERRAVL